MRIFIPCLLFLVLFSGCQSAKHASSSGGWDYNKSLEGGFEKNAGEAQSRKVIYNAELRLAVKNSDSTNSALSKIAEQNDGYVQSLGNSYSVIRVKAEKLNGAVNEIAKLGKLKEKSISGEDVTEDYVDFEIKLDNLYKSREKYLDLLKKAENVEAALKVEKELERVNGEINSIEGKLKRLQHLSDYSTITVHHEVKAKLGPLGYVVVGVYKVVKWMFVRG